jgi:hypothetical protein
MLFEHVRHFLAFSCSDKHLPALMEAVQLLWHNLEQWHPQQASLGALPSQLWALSE